jgi:hypothetical protein
MKKRAEKLRENKFSKADDDLDEETYLGMSEEFDDSKFSRKSDKWLKERARYDEGLTDKEKENIKISSLDSLLSNINNYYDDEIYLNKLIIGEIAL